MEELIKELPGQLIIMKEQLHLLDAIGQGYYINIPYTIFFSIKEQMCLLQTYALYYMFALLECFKEVDAKCTVAALYILPLCLPTKCARKCK